MSDTYKVQYTITRIHNAYVEADSPEAAEAFVVKGGYRLALDEDIVNGKTINYTVPFEDDIPSRAVGHKA